MEGSLEGGEEYIAAVRPVDGRPDRLFSSWGACMEDSDEDYCASGS